MRNRGFNLVTITKNRTNPAYDGARLGVDRVLARLGGTARHCAPARPDDVNEQRGLIETAIAAAPDAILLFPAHPAALDPTLVRVKEAGIALFYCVSRAEGVAPVSYVSSDNYEPAQAVAGRLFEHLDGQGKVAIIEGDPDAPTSPPRTEGFRAAAARHPGIEIVACRRGNFHRKDGRLAMAAILADHVQLDGVLAANDAMAMGALEAMDAAGCLVPTTGINATPDAIEAIKAGRLLATASFEAMTMACVAAEAAVRHLRGERVPALITLLAETVDADNCALGSALCGARAAGLASVGTCHRNVSPSGCRP